MVINGLPAATRLPASPPIRLHGDKTILIHMLGYEDWTPRSPNGSTSRTSSGHGSSAPTIARFDWVEGVIDGRPVQTWRVRPEACHGLPERQEPRDEDHDGDDDDFRVPPRRSDVPRSTWVRQLFPNCTSERSVRVRTRSPPGYNRRMYDDFLPMERGRLNSRSPPRGRRSREALQHASEDWERRRSHSPLARSWDRPGSGAADPLLDHLRPYCSDHFDPLLSQPFQEDPMVQEFAIAAGT